MEYQDLAEEIGFSSVASGPFVRSSFDAAGLYEKIIRRNDNKLCKVTINWIASMFLIGTMARPEGFEPTTLGSEVLGLFSINFEAKLLFCAYPCFSFKNLFLPL